MLSLVERLALETAQSPTKLILAGLFFLALGAFFLWSFGPLLARDWGIAATQPASDARIVEGRCKTRLVLVNCELKIERRDRTGVQRIALDYLWLDMPFTSHEARPLLSAADKSVVTTDLGQDMLWNRGLTLVAASAFLFSPLIIVPIALRRRSRAASA